MQPQVVLIEHLVSKPKMERCTSLSPQLGNDPSGFTFTIGFFAWWKRQVLIVEDYPYAKVDFRGNADLVLPEGAHWDASGM